jgi:hypothetical protein
MQWEWQASSIGMESESSEEANELVFDTGDFDCGVDL